MNFYIDACPESTRPSELNSHIFGENSSSPTWWYWSSLPDPAARDERVLAGLRNEKTWIVWDGDIAAATITITTRRNNAVWSNPACTADLTERAVFVHRLIQPRCHLTSVPD